MDTREILSITVGIVILAYVGYCLVNQKVWVRGEIGLKSTVFAWSDRADHPTIFILHTIIGTIFGTYMLASPFLW